MSKRSRIGEGARWSDHQRRQVANAARDGRVFVTMIEGSVVLVLPPRSEVETVRLVARLAQVLETITSEDSRDG